MPDPLRTIPAAVATHHPLATEAARRMLSAGGNATDAAVAAMATLCVCVPGSVGFGGYGGTMVAFDAASARVRCLDFNTRAPSEYRDDLFADDTTRKASLGYLSLSVPAVIAGLNAALRHFGTRSWRDATAFAIDLAEDGFEVDEHNRYVLEQWHQQADDHSRRAHFPETVGEIPHVGQRWTQQHLATLLRRLADQGIDSFYRGDIAERIINQIRANGGIVSRDDLASYQPTVIDAIAIDYRGHTILTPPPPSGGLTTLQILQTLEHFDIASMEPWSAPYLHLVAEVCKRCWSDRQRLGDPDFVNIDYAELLATSLASSRATDIRQHDIKSGVEARIDDFPHTCNVSIIDRAGNTVSMTATQGAQFGSGVVIEGLGLVLGHGMSRFDFKPNHPNRPAPGKRPLHNMVPTVILKNHKPFAAFGLPGGTRISTVTAQLAVSLIDFQATPEQAVHATRVHSEGGEPLVVSKSIPQNVARDLESLGHKLIYGDHALGVPIMVGGPASVVRVTPAGDVAAASTTSPAAAAVVP